MHTDICTKKFIAALLVIFFLKNWYYNSDVSQQENDFLKFRKPYNVQWNTMQTLKKR